MDQSSSASLCQTCQRTLGTRTKFAVRKSGDEVLICLRCVLKQAPMLRRSAIIALIVGTLQIVINQGDVILAGDASSTLMWKIPLTVIVPFAVATVGALTNSRRTTPGTERQRRPV